MFAQTSETIPLNEVQLCIAAGLVAAAGLMSIVMRLNVEKRLALASVRMVLQLLIVGYVLKWVFRIDTVWAVVGVVLIMVTAASLAAMQRSSRWVRGLGIMTFGSLTFSGLLTTVAVTGLIIGVEPLWKPQYFIPLLGMVLGNSLTGVSLCVDYLLETFSVRQAEVELVLSLGGTRWQAAREPIRQAIRRGMIPIINSMMVVGLVSLPGMMTGQILAGNSPVEAVKYQIVVMFMISAGTAMAAILAAVLVFFRLFNSKHQLKINLIKKRKE